MRDTALLQQALSLAPPWTVSRSDFDPEAHRLDVEIDFAPGSRFACPTCGAADCSAYDTERMTWRHLNFFQHEAYLHARVPRVRCDKCGIKTVNVPWARPGSGFTLLFEALVMTMVAAMPVKAVARIVGEHDTRLWRVIHHYVDEARARTNASGVTRLAIDETAARRGQDYVTLFVDIDQARVMFATEGNDAATIAAFADDLTAHGGDPDAISQVCIDMSPAFTKGIAENLPNAAITFDKFHAVKIINSLPRRRPGMRSIRYAVPNRRSKVCCAAHVISGCAIRRRCPIASAQRSVVCPHGTSRPLVRIRSVSPFKTSTNSHLCRRGRVI
jgi:transposase